MARVPGGGRWHPLACLLTHRGELSLSLQSNDWREKRRGEGSRVLIRGDFVSTQYQRTPTLVLSD